MADDSPQVVTVANAAPAASPPADRQKPLIFISHDARDADLAEAFAELLGDVSAGMLKSFRSSDKREGIGFGAHWYREVMSKLGDATDVVALLTQFSIDRPWILYEAGVAAGKLSINVLGVTLGIPLEKVSMGPFGQFQNCGDDEESLTKLVIQLTRRHPDASLREERVRKDVRAFRERVDAILCTKEGAVAPGGSPVQETSIAKLFEEIKVMVREIPERVDNRLRSQVVKVGEVRFPKGSPEAQKFYDGRHRGPRKVQVPVVFDSSFTKIPQVITSLRKVDVGDVKSNINRISVDAENIRGDGFDLFFETWEDSVIYDAVAAWTAVGE